MIFTDPYGQKWQSKPDALLIEFNMIRRKWKEHLGGKDCAEDLLKHYLAARKLIWPDRYCHRWTELIYREIIKNSITILMGAASSQKTSHADEFSLIRLLGLSERNGGAGEQHDEGQTGGCRLGGNEKFMEGGPGKLQVAGRAPD